MSLRDSAVIIGLALGAAMLGAGACTEKLEPAPNAPVTTGPLFTPDSVQVIFDGHCIECHSGTSPPAGQDLSADSSYAMIVNHVSIKCAPLFRIKPFDPANSCLMSRITGRVTPRMPIGGRPALSAADTLTIHNWIVNGAPGVTRAP